MSIKKIVLYLVLIVVFIGFVYFDSLMYIKLTTGKDGWFNFKFETAYYYMHFLLISLVSFLLMLSAKYGSLKSFKNADVRFDFKRFILMAIPIFILLYVFSYLGLSSVASSLRLHGSVFNLYTKIIENRLTHTILSMGLGYIIATSFKSK